MTDNPVIDTGERFELEEEGLTAFADYYPRGEALVIPHVEAPVALRGKGTAGRLMAGVVAHARDKGIKLIPTCSYARAWFMRHKDDEDVLA